jgi:hypothetical protein
MKSSVKRAPELVCSTISQICGPTPTIELLAVCADKESSALQGGTRGAEFIDLWDRGRERRRLTVRVRRGFSGLEGAHRRRGRRCCVLSRPACSSDFLGRTGRVFPIFVSAPPTRRVGASPSPGLALTS